MRDSKNDLLQSNARNAELPTGWTLATLREITSPVCKINPRNNPSMEFAYLDIGSITDRHEITSHKVYLGKDAPSRARQIIKSGDILFSTVRTYLKNITLVDDRYDNQIASTGFCVIRPINPINSKFIFYLLLTDEFLDPLNQLQRGTNYPAVTDSDVLSQEIAIAPIQEQYRMVSTIEELLTKLNTVCRHFEKYRSAT